MNVIKYLINKKVFFDVVDISVLTNGASGAKVYSVTDKNGEYVVKQSEIITNGNSDRVYLDNKEYFFYQFMKDLDLDIPRVIYSEEGSRYGYILIFPFYKSLSFSEWDIDYQLKAVDLIAKFNSMDIEEISTKLNISYKRVGINTEELKAALKQWSSILSLFPKEFDFKKLEDIYNNFDNVCNILNSGIKCVCHGDFHAENMLLDKGRILLADWQNINIGNARGDISFFISRGKASGLVMNEDELIQYYCKRVYYYSGTDIRKDDVYEIINASNVFTSFLHWPFYLKGTDIERVQGIYESMIKSFDALF